MEHVGVIDVEQPIPDSRGVRTREWKYIRYLGVEPEVEELYHLASDPLETRNLAADAEHAASRRVLEKVGMRPARREVDEAGAWWVYVTPGG